MPKTLNHAGDGFLPYTFLCPTHKHGFTVVNDGLQSLRKCKHAWGINLLWFGMYCSCCFVSYRFKQPFICLLWLSRISYRMANISQWIWTHLHRNWANSFWIISALYWPFSFENTTWLECKKSKLFCSYLRIYRNLMNVVISSPRAQPEVAM